MFNLEKSIAEWREQMLAAGIKTPTPLDELEGHLREGIELQIKTGVDARKAFEVAVLQMGKAAGLKNEFKKINGSTMALEKLMIGICVIFIGFIVFLGGATVVLCFAGLGDRVMAATAMATTVAVAYGWVYVVPYLPVIAGRRKRLIVGLACIASGFLCAAFYANVILPRFVVEDHQAPAAEFWMAFLVAVFSCLGVGLCLGPNERESLGVKRRKFSATANSLRR